MTIPRDIPRRGTIIETASDIRFFDVTMSEEYSDEVTPTDHEAEDGSPISDHAKIEPIRYKCQGLLTDTPRKQVGDLGRAQRIYDGLLAMKNARELATLTTGRRTLQNMLMISCALREQSPAMEGLVVACEWKEIKIVTSIQVFIPAEVVPDDDDRDRAQDTVDEGPQEAEPSTDEEAKVAAGAVTDNATALYRGLPEGSADTIRDEGFEAAAEEVYRRFTGQ